jgi:hypothetical protein
VLWGFRREATLFTFCFGVLGSRFSSHIYVCGSLYILASDILGVVGYIFLANAVSVKCIECTRIYKRRCLFGCMRFCFNCDLEYPLSEGL